MREIFRPWFCGQRGFADKSGQSRMVILVQPDRTAAGTQITTLYNLVQKRKFDQRCISECTANRNLRQMDNSRRPCQLQLLSAKNRKLRLKWAQGHQNWTTEDREKVACTDESRFLQRHTGGRVRIWHQQHQSMDPTCLV